MSKVFNCRSCDSNQYESRINLGSQAHSGFFLDKDKSSQIPRGELHLVECDKCSLVQLLDSIDPSISFNVDYGYNSSLNKSMANHLHRKIDRLLNQYFKQLNLENFTIIDIGSNDGTLLNNESLKGSRRIGIDPTIKLWAENYEPDIEKICSLFDAHIIKDIGGIKADLITTIAMFYDLPKPLEFARNVNDLLKKDGIWHIELSYLPTMIQKNSYDTICHEHLEYYSLSSLKYICDNANLKIVNVFFNDLNGGSVGIDVAKLESHYLESPFLNFLLNKEKLKLNRSSWDLFKKNIEINSQDLLKILTLIKKNGFSVSGLGASTKGNTILQYSKIDNDLLNNILEINPKKFGKVTPGSSIKIVNEKDINDDLIDYKLILPWHFKHSIMQNEIKFLHKGGKLIFPIPQLEIVSF
jgi:hypothetical protein